MWNNASRLLPISLAGQLIVCEPLDVLAYVFLTGHYLPSFLEAVGIVLVIDGVLVGLRATRYNEPPKADERRTSVLQEAAGYRT